MNYAFGESFEKTSCNEKAISKKELSDSCEKDCCKKNQNSKKDQHGCSGKCDHSGCTTSGQQFSLISENEFDFNNNTYNFPLKKQVLYYTEIGISDGFTSIWSPPKIK
ncbi:hypothetical protein ACEN2I_11785 [Flavobacterium sp. W22_SRS_FK3]|uniref:hypothetical protein n=1 Tax=Flavobacterium sp. W22_SRS_FK3 TaxID=3240275 RepID=UPI003F93EF83